MSPNYDEDVKKLRDELELIASNGTEVWWRQERARQVRFNEWDGQSPDGRKHGDAMDGEALPFEGAPDNRIPMVDAVINEKVMLARHALSRALTQAKPTEPDDAARASNVSALLAWLRNGPMREDLDVEVELSAQYIFGDDPGVCVMEVTWLRDLGLERQILTFDQLAAMWATGAQSPEEIGEAAPEPEMLAEFTSLATDPERGDEWIRWLEAMFPGATRKALRKAARDLTRDGEAELPVPAIRENRPRVQALKLFDDIFFPIGTVDLQRARTIHRREFLSDVELRERVHTYGWDSEWVEDVIERGKGQSLLSYPLRWRQWAAFTVTLAGPGRAVNERDNLFEVWWSYKREPDELGVPGIVCTVWSSVVNDRPARRTVADYPHGKYPFVMATRERIGRQTTDSRGLSVPIATHQLEVKIQRDARGTYVQQLAAPPKKVKMNRGARELNMGPNAEIPVQKMDDFEIVTMPDFMEHSVEMERRTQDEADHYCGVMRTDADPNRVGMVQQDDSDRFFALWRAAFVQVIALAQYYYTAEDLARITGQDDTPLHLSPEDIRGRYDVSIEIDARDLNMEFALKKMEAFGKVLQYDSEGRLARGPLAEWAAYAVDPILARRTVQPADTATKRMLDEERSNVANMMLGIEPIMNPEGVSNPQARLQTVFQTIAQNPRASLAYQGDALFRQLASNYQRYLTQQIEQEHNKVIGRLGVAPSQGAPGLYPALNPAK